MMSPTIYGYVKSEEAKFQTTEVQVGDNWMWNLRNHVQLIFHLKNGIFYTGDNDWTTIKRCFKNIIEPILNLAYWTEDLEVKDVEFFIKEGRHRSFLVKKYHDEIFVKEHNLDTLFDEITESDLDYGGVLVQRSDSVRPEVKQLNEIAFCDQTEILGGPLFFRLNFAPEKLRGMAKVGWGDEKNGATISIDDLIVLADQNKSVAGTVQTKDNEVTGKAIEVYFGHGNLPEHYLYDDNNMEDYCLQVQVIAYYTDKENKKHGVTLYRAKEKEGNIKFHTSKKVNGRALGRGVAESLLHDQIWTNFLSIHKMRLLESASKIVPWTDDEGFTERNNLNDVDNLEWQKFTRGSQVGIIPTAAPVNIQLYEKSINEFFEHAQLIGSAFDPILGVEPPSGSTFRGQERTVAQGRGLHDRRRGQRAKFIEEIYRDWIIPYIVREITKGKKFLSSLTAEEMQWVSEQMAENYANNEQFEALWRGEIPAEKDELKKRFLADFVKKGSKHLIEILKGEFEGIEIEMGINIAGKQKNLANLSDKVLSIFQFVFANPQAFQAAMQVPALARAFNDILEFSGISQVEFSSLMSTPIPMAPAPNTPQPTQPMKLNQPVAA